MNYWPWPKLLPRYVVVSDVMACFVFGGEEEGRTCIQQAKFFSNKPRD